MHGHLIIEYYSILSSDCSKLISFLFYDNSCTCMHNEFGSSITSSDMYAASTQGLGVNAKA